MSLRNIDEISITPIPFPKWNTLPDGEAATQLPQNFLDIPDLEEEESCLPQ